MLSGSGSGLAISTVRYECERRGRVLVRINPREADTPAGGVALPLGALEALGKMDVLLGAGGKGDPRR